MNGGDTSESTTIEVPALGRPFLLGMLYDCRNDTLIPGVTLWNGDALRSDVESKTQENTSFELLASDTISDKSSALNVSASLKASFLSGLVNVDGSANYLNDIKSSNHQARVTLKYSRTTKFDQLTMNHLGSKNMTYTEVFDKGTATHVVTAILYGAQAFFIFDREVSSSENTQDIQGNLEVIIKKIPSISIEGKGDVTLTDREKQSKDTFSCKFYGDFALDSNPVNYEDAINLYKSLPKRLGENGEKAVPVKVWLYPLKKLDNRAAQLLREISENNLYKAEAIIQQMTDVKMRCNDLMRQPTAKNFPDMKRSIGQFREYCEQFTLMFQKQLAHTLTSIRRDQLDEEKLMEVLIRAERSPFGKLQVEEYLSRRQQEMDTVESFINKLHPVKVLSSEHELNKVVTDPKVQYIVCYCFTSLNDEEEYLSDLRKWLQTDESSTNDIHQSNKVELWIKNKELHQKARRYLQEFQEFSQSNTTSNTQSNTLRQNIQYIISAFCDTNNPGASIRLYEAGSLVNDRFSPPAKPSPPTILSMTHERVKLSLKPADYGKEFVTGYKIGYRIHNEEKWDNHTIETPAQEVTFKGLQPNKTYEFRCSSMCKAGLSAVSDLVTGRTLPTSPPESIQCNADLTCLQLQWKEPSVKGEGVIIRGYKVQYKHENQSWSEMRTKTKRENCEIRGLNPETVYTIRLLAVCGDHGVSAPSDEKVISTPKFFIKYQLLKDSTLLTKAKPSVHQLKTIHSESGYRKFVLGEENSAMGSKVILLVGATGSGKTTLINGMANYILGVDWNDDFRFKLVHEITNQSEAHSQTSQVTAYEINHNPGYKIPYSLTLIDTPGFGDTRGIEQDKKITESISKFFTSDDGIDQIDAVCFVVQASLARLTHTQKYIFNAVFSIFGKDIKDNILILINFCDGEKPPVLEAIKTGNIPCTPDSNGDPTHFKFNNSALCANNQSSNVSFNQMFWDMGAHSMETFFTSLGKLEAKSLKLTKEVLQERKKLEVNLQGLQPQIKAGLVKLEEIRKTEINLEQNKDLMEANKNFEFEVEVTVPKQEEIHGHFITNCQQCHFTCHEICQIP
uniref:Fibronectin type-III domain-containing protein n=1 Tax=Leptobrachium leishanense TaxID=445787 RepID=A0A8C5PGP8_9ANUR